MSHLNTPALPSSTGRVLVHRHALAVRLTHWLNVLALGFLLFSGLQIFNAHPALYWGKYGANSDASVLAIDAIEEGGALRGVTRIGSLELTTTGVLGVSFVSGEPRARAFPTWLTLPSYQDLAAGRRLHFFFAWLFVANGAVYLLYGLVSGHFLRNLAPTRAQLGLRHLWCEILNHARLRFPKGSYNTLQKLSYIVVIFLLLPLMVLTGLAMSPGMNAVFPWLPDILGGRQSARTLHFIAASLLVAFVVVHLALVLASGPINNLRGMIIGRHIVKIPGGEP